MTTIAPDLRPSHVTGYRLFVVDIERLCLASLTGNTLWLPGEIQKAECRVSKAITRAHVDQFRSPHPQCTCGIWSVFSRKGIDRVYPWKSYIKNPEAFKRVNNQTVHSIVSQRRAARPFLTIPRKALKGKTVWLVSAQIEQWGIVLKHSDGYRSEFARIIPATIHAYPRIHQDVHQKKLIAEIKRRYCAI